MPKFACNFLCQSWWMSATEPHLVTCIDVNVNQSILICTANQTLLHHPTHKSPNNLCSGADETELTWCPSPSAELLHWPCYLFVGRFLSSCYVNWHGNSFLYSTQIESTLNDEWRKFILTVLCWRPRYKSVDLWNCVMEICLWIRVRLRGESGLIETRVGKNTSPPIHLNKGCVSKVWWCGQQGLMNGSSNNIHMQLVC